MLFDVGQILGATGGGYVCDRTRAPVTVNGLMLLASALPLHFLNQPPGGLSSVGVLLVVTGEDQGGGPPQAKD